MNPPDGAVKAVGRGRGPWRADQNVIELRRPQNVSFPSETSSSSNASSVNHVEDTLSVAVQSKLSVDAKEFVPRGFTCAATTTNSSEPYDSISNNYYEFDGQEDNVSEMSDITADEWVIHHLTDVIKRLTDNPGQFDQLAKPLLDELIPMLAAEETMESVVLVIVNQAISERNFRYNGARLCNLLNNHRLPGENSAFRRILLNKLCEEHERIENNLEHNPERVFGFVHFMGELYIQLELNKGLGVRIAILGDALLEALKILIQIPLVDNVKQTCDVLKLAGRLLETDQPEATKSFFSDFQNLLSDERAGSRVKDMISNILKLRSENWGHAASSENPSTPNSSISESNTPVWGNEGIYYGPDHQALTPEEIKFLNDNCGKDESVSVGDVSEDLTVWDPDVNDTENAEIMAAFHEFVNQRPR